MCTCFAYMYITYLTGVQGSHKGVSNPLKLELQTVVNCHAVAVMKPRSSGRTVGALPPIHLSSPYLYSQTHSLPCTFFYHSLPC